MPRASLIGRSGLFVACLIGAACGDEVVRWRDPDVVTVDGGAGGHGPTVLVVGFGQGDAFVALDEVAVQVVVRGIQGGNWTLPTLRADTLAAMLAVDCQLVTSAGETLGATAVTTPTRPAMAGWVEVGLLPIPVSHAPPATQTSIADLEGAAATITCSVAAAGSRATTAYPVTLDVP